MAVSPMMQQYLQIKEQYKDAILFFRLGDFYEMFFDDAILVSRELELTLTGKDCGLSERAPMCGVPFHAAETYLARLIEKGYKVAICEQMSDPATTKGLVEREVIRVVTPGTVIETNMLEDTRANYILCVCVQKKRAGIAFADVSTGEFRYFSLEDMRQSIADELARIQPREIIANDPTALAACVPEHPAGAFDSDAFEYAHAAKWPAGPLSQEHCRSGVGRKPPGVCAAGRVACLPDRNAEKRLDAHGGIGAPMNAQVLWRWTVRRCATWNLPRPYRGGGGAARF